MNDDVSESLCSRLEGQRDGGRKRNYAAILNVSILLVDRGALCRVRVRQTNHEIVHTVICDNNRQLCPLSCDNKSTQVSEQSDRAMCFTRIMLSHGQVMPA